MTSFGRGYSFGVYSSSIRGSTPLNRSLPYELTLINRQVYPLKGHFHLVTNTLTVESLTYRAHSKNDTFGVAKTYVSGEVARTAKLINLLARRLA